MPIRKGGELRLLWSTAQLPFSFGFCIVLHESF